LTEWELYSAKKGGTMMKPAVFEISECGGQTRLVCISVGTLGEAVELEGFLRRHVPHIYVRLLGRFDRIEFASSLDEFIDAVASDAFVRKGRFEGTMRRLMNQQENRDSTTPQRQQERPSSYSK
jgi:hypothetical protein